LSPANEQAVIAIVRDFLDAVARGDRKAIRARHADDVLMYDFPDTVRGIAEYDRTWDFFFDSQRGPITFAPSEIKASAGEDVAFVTCEVHCDGTKAGPLDLRLAVGLEKRGGNWVIAHEHHSLPTRDEEMVMPEKREALSPDKRSH
jgi:ketosteroid isomerase-like protein